MSKDISADDVSQLIEAGLIENFWIEE